MKGPLFPARHEKDYLGMLQNLLPRGLAWTRSFDSRLYRFLLACAGELARVDSASHFLVDEIHPLTCVAALEDWERVLGLPDQCLPTGDSLQERRAAVLARLRDQGRQDLAYWYDLAETLGYEIVIEEHWPFICGIHHCADPSGLSLRERQDYRQIGYLGVEEVRLWWNVLVLGDRLILFRCGESLCPELLLDWVAADTLECVFQRDSEAHLLLTFDYPGE